MKKRQMIIGAVSILAMMIAINGVVTAQWWIVLGIPPHRTDPLIYLLSNVTAVFIGLLVARLWLLIEWPREEVRPRGEKEANLESQCHSLKKANEELSLFTHALVHDLKGPMNVARGFSEELLESYTGDDETTRDGMVRVHRSIRRMDVILNGLVQLCHVGNGRIVTGAVDVTRLAQEIVDNLKESDPERDIGLDIQPNMSIEADQAMLEIALTNLLSNAWKFTRGRPGPMIRVEQPCAGMIKVTDNGVGFEPEQEVKIFKPFHRCHSKDQFEGSGIGLSTVKRIAERHGGRVWAEGRPGEGASFFLGIK